MHARFPNTCEGADVFDVGRLLGVMCDGPPKQGASGTAVSYVLMLYRVSEQSSLDAVLEQS